MATNGPAASDSKGRHSPEASFLVGELDQDGFAHLERVAKDLLSASIARPDMGRSQDSSNSTRSVDSSMMGEEDYDKLSIDPQTVVEGSSGGGLKAEPTLQPLHSTHSHPSRTRQDDIAKPSSSSLSERRKSIPIKLKKTDIKGKYMLSTDEPEIREILRRSIQREMEGEGGKNKRTRFSDLVFTRQFTAFDRQNPNTAASPFHGFFVLAWMGIMFLLIKLAANNWRIYGNILGQNELYTLMFRRDVVVLGLSDVAMMLSTVFCLVLQKAIFARWISWDGLGWIIQSLWQLFYVSATIGWTIHRDWPWTHTIFLVLHCIVMLMKQHSFAFYNGHCKFISRNSRSKR